MSAGRIAAEMPPALPAVRLAAKAASADALQLSFTDTPPQRPGPGQALVRVHSAGVNPSDVKAALGLMPQAVFPRTPGRDYAGTVAEGPADWVGKAVWGSGGDIGVTRDGSHAGWLLLPAAALREKPARLSFDEAGSVGVPFVTACEGFRRSGWPKPGQVVAVMGANGKVGQAAVQLALQAGARVIAVQRQQAGAGGGRQGAVTAAPLRAGGGVADCGAGVDVVDARQGDVAARLRELTGGHGVDTVFNTVGSPYFDAANKAMAKGGTQIFIATVERPVPFDIFTFYRGMHTYVGIDTLALDAEASGERLAMLHDGFEAGTLRPFAIDADAVYALADAAEAYRRVIGGAAQRVVLRLPAAAGPAA